MVYVNYGRVEDFQKLERELGINVTGKIAIARYGKIFRGDKVMLSRRKHFEISRSNYLSLISKASLCLMGYYFSAAQISINFTISQLMLQFCCKLRVRVKERRVTFSGDLKSVLSCSRPKVG